MLSLKHPLTCVRTRYQYKPSIQPPWYQSGVIFSLATPATVCIHSSRPTSSLDCTRNQSTLEPIHCRRCRCRCCRFCRHWLCLLVGKYIRSQSGNASTTNWHICHISTSVESTVHEFYYETTQSIFIFVFSSNEIRSISISLLFSHRVDILFSKYIMKLKD